MVEKGGGELVAVDKGDAFEAIALDKGREDFVCEMLMKIEAIEATNEAGVGEGLRGGCEQFGDLLKRLELVKGRLMP